jgi:hypothetical protein
MELEEPGVVKLEKFDICPFVPGVNVELRLIEEPGVDVPEDRGLSLGDLGVDILLLVVEENPYPLGPKPVADSGKLKKLVPIDPILVAVSIPKPAQVEDGKSQLLFRGEKVDG